MQALERLLGLYLGLCYVTLPVVCYHLWKRGRAVHATWLLALPLVVWGAWAGAGSWLSREQGLYLGIGLLPLLLLPLLAPAQWLVSATGDFRGSTGTAFRAIPFAALAWILRVLALPGVAWFAYGLLRPGDACARTATLLDAGAGPVAPGAIVSCVSSAVGAWPLLLLVVWVVTGKAWRAARPAGTPQPGTDRSVEA